MAQEIVIQLNVEGVDEATQSIEELDRSIKGVQGTVSSGSIGKIVNDNDTQKIDNFEKKLVSTRDVMKTSQATARLLTGSVKIATSAFAAFGVNNEEVAQTLLRVQSAAQFAGGLRDLARGLGALSKGFDVLSIAIKAVPFVAIAAAVLGFLQATGLLEPILQGIGSLLTPLTDGIKSLGAAFGLSGKDAAGAAVQVAEYEAALNSLNFAATINLAFLEKELILAEANKKSQEEILEIKGRIAKQTIDDAGEEIRLNGIRIEQLKDTIITEKLRGKEKIDIENQIASIKQKDANLNAKIITTEAQQEAETIKLKRQRQEEKAEQDKKNLETSINNGKKLTEEEAKRLEEIKKLQEEAAKAVEFRIKKENDDIIQAGKVQLSELKTRLVAGEITEETFAAERILLEKETNDKLIELKENQRLTDAEKLQVGLENSKNLNKKITEQNAKEILDIEDKNSDIKLNIIKGNEKSTTDAIKQAQDDRIETIDREFLQKKIDLLNNELIKEVELADALKQLEIDKNKVRLETLLVGSSEYLTLKAQIIEQELALDKSKSDEQKKIEEQNFNFIKNLNEQLFTTLQGFTDAAFQFKKNTLEKGSKEEEKFAKKQFKVNKALSLSSAIISGFLATLEAYKNGMKNPVPLLGPATAAVYAGLAAISSGALIAKIASTKFEGGSTGGSTSSSISVPSLNTSGSISPQTFQPDTFGTGVSQSQTFGGQSANGGGNVLRAYVSEADITATSRRLGGIRNASEL